MAGQQMATSWAWPLAWPHPAPASVGLSHIPRADTLPRAAGMHVPQGRGTARAPWAALPSRGGMAPVLPPHGAALTCCQLPAPPSQPQHLAAHPDTELQGGKGAQRSAAGGHTHPPGPCHQAAFTHGTPSPWCREQWQPWPVLPVLYLAASTGLAQGPLVHLEALPPTGLLGGGRAAWAPFLPCCLVLPLGLVLLRLLATIFGLQTGLRGWLQLQEHKGPRDHNYGREKRLRMEEACSRSPIRHLARLSAPLGGTMLPSPPSRPHLQLVLLQCWAHCRMGLCHRHSWGLTLGTGFLGVSCLPAAQLLHPSRDMLLLRCGVLLVGLGRAGSESGANPASVSDRVTLSHPCHPARDVQQAVASSHATQVPACLLPGMHRGCCRRLAGGQVSPHPAASTRQGRGHCLLKGGPKPRVPLGLLGVPLHGTDEH